MKVIVLTTNSPNQWALCHKLGEVCSVEGIVVSRNMVRKPRLGKRILQLIRRIEGRIWGRAFIAAWNGMLAEYASRYPGFPAAAITPVDNINDKETLEAVALTHPDVVIVSGTNLLKDSTIETIKRTAPLINLHTGISPYVKGGPNCTNWCLATDSLELIGNTVMWLDAGIDTGDLIATEQTPLEGTESLTGLHIKVMEHAHRLMCRVLERMASGKELHRVKQVDVGQGRTFFNRDWSASAMHRASRNFARHYPEIRNRQNRKAVRLVRTCEPS